MWESFYAVKDAFDTLSSLKNLVCLIPEFEILKHRPECRGTLYDSP